MAGNNVTHEQNFERLECWKACRELRLLVERSVKLLSAYIRYLIKNQSRKVVTTHDSTTHQ